MFIMLKNKKEEEEEDEIIIIDSIIRIRKRLQRRHYRPRRRLSIYEQSRIINPGQKRKQKTLRYRKAKKQQKVDTINTTTEANNTRTITVKIKKL
jgi:hypothetical protein